MLFLRQLLCASLAALASAKSSGYDFVDPFIGTKNGGKAPQMVSRRVIAVDMRRPRLSWCNFAIWSVYRI